MLTPATGLIVPRELPDVITAGGDLRLERVVNPEDYLRLGQLAVDNLFFLARHFDWKLVKLDESNIFIKTDRESDGESVDFMIVNGDELVGKFDVHHQQDDELEVGYWIAESAQGNGFAARSLQAGRDELLNDPTLQRINLQIKPANIRSQRVAQRNGAQHVGPGETNYDLWQIDRSAQHAALVAA